MILRLLFLHDLCIMILIRFGKIAERDGICLKKLWIQYIIMILCAGTLFAAFPVFSNQIPLAEAEVDWQNDAYINQFGDKVIPLPSSDLDLSSKLPSSEQSSDLSVSSAAETESILSSAAGRPLSSAATDPAVSTIPIPESSAPASSLGNSSAASSKPAASSSSASASSAGISSSPAGTTEETVYILENGEAVQYRISELLPRIVEAEIGGGSPVEAIKAQAVASHTLLRYYNDVAKKAPAVAQKTPTDAVIKACMEVIDKIITVDGQPAYTPYCAATAGRTNASEEVWGGKRSHLVSVESIYDSEDTTNWNRQTTIPVSTVKEKLEASFGVTMTGEPSSWMKVLDYTKGGYNNNMSVCGKLTTGRYIRESVLGLRSACFTWKVEGDNFIFTTKGYGHGVGLSQMGAIGYARHGYQYDWILTHYYTGVSISTL